MLSKPLYTETSLPNHTENTMNIKMSAPTAFRSRNPLDNATIAHYAPSVFAQEAHDSRGERYAFIPTSDVLEGLRAEGFEPYEVRQTRVRDLNKREHTKHLLRLRHPTALKNDAGHGEIILPYKYVVTNSFQLM